MVCERCIYTVRKELNDLGIPVADVKLGEVTTLRALNLPDITAIEKRLKPLGFSLLENKTTKLVREVKALVEQVYSGNYDFPDNFRFSAIIEAGFHKEYEMISSAFSQAESITLEKYIIQYRIEKVKELLVYTKLTLDDIAFKLGFSGKSHLSRQFKTETGLPPSHFKKVRSEKESVKDHSEHRI